MLIKILIQLVALHPSTAFNEIFDEMFSLKKISPEFMVCENIFLMNSHNHFCCRLLDWKL